MCIVQLVLCALLRGCGEEVEMGKRGSRVDSLNFSSIYKFRFSCLQLSDAAPRLIFQAFFLTPSQDQLLPLSLQHLKYLPV